MSHADRETRARDYHREVDDGSTWDLLSEEQRDCYRQAADRLHAKWCNELRQAAEQTALRVGRELGEHAVGYRIANAILALAAPLPDSDTGGKGA